MVFQVVGHIDTLNKCIIFEKIPPTTITP